MIGPISPSRPDLAQRRSAPSWGGTRGKARLRRWLARALVVLAPLALVAFDFAKRRARIVEFERDELAFYFGSAALGVALWSFLLAAATRNRGTGRWPVRILIAVWSLLAVGSQLY